MDALPQPLGILGAMESEVEAIVAALAEPQSMTVLGCRVLAGRLDGWPLLLARSGIGKVNATLTTAALAQAGAAGLIFVGMAGSLEAGIQIGDAVIATDLVQHDIDITAFGHQPGTISGEIAGGVADISLSDRLALAAVEMGATVHRGRIASGDQFIGSSEQGQAIARQFGAIAVEMEGAAVAQACRRLQLPCAVLRWVSDTADDKATADFPVFVRQISELDLAIIRRVVAVA